MARILVIEDNPDVRALIADALETAGHSVAQAADGEAGLAAQRAAPADLVISDIIMPEKEGIETIRDLKLEFPALRIIAITGGDSRLSASNLLFTARTFGADTVLTKPFSADDLLKAVDASLAARARR